VLAECDLFLVESMISDGQDNLMLLLFTIANEVLHFLDEMFLVLAIEQFQSAFPLQSQLLSQNVD
jgi:hypothetical protein